MLLRQSSSAPASWNSRLLACQHSFKARKLWPVQVLAPTANHHLLRIVRGPVSLMSARTTRPSSEDESVASTPLQETVFRPIGWSQCSHTTLPDFVLNVVVVRWSGRTTQEIRQTGCSILSGQL
jgi:hypothetical protein